ncbi:A/G-specific adenine glycosylase [Oceanobacillus halotolerans]|uniref:A/G-specific adenine glycosylase n=1 Tax=Oceanobacillus halotolerans TaxID=2663380 RepID=UPI0013DD1FA4|nr:A/G-specific adenine glycosylase [Oceanobacillus halotolerans]
MDNKTLQNIDISAFQHDLIDWYEREKRDLPWRQDQDPYKVWVSEIMLQQTKVDTVIPYFYHFIKQFPTVYDLAEADEQAVLKAWEGLGYYSRARNLQTAVKEVVASYSGEVPSEPKQLEKLKGIGSYTKGAILSIAYGQAEPAVDGNVMRVLSRVLKIEEDISVPRTKKLFESIVRELISKENPSSFNQGIMDLGAMVCTPKAPMCMLCPIQQHCTAFDEGIEQQLPIKSKGKKTKTVPLVALLIQNDQKEYLIEQRPSKGLLANLWQFPMAPIAEIGFDHIENWFQSEYGIAVTLMENVGTQKHVFSHLVWDLAIYKANTVAEETLDERLTFVKKEDLDNFPFPVSHQKMMTYI